VTLKMKKLYLRIIFMLALFTVPVSLAWCGEQAPSFKVYSAWNVSFGLIYRGSIHGLENDQELEVWRDGEKIGIFKLYDVSKTVSTGGFAPFQAGIVLEEGDILKPKEGWAEKPGFQPAFISDMPDELMEKVREREQDRSATQITEAPFELPGKGPEIQAPPEPVPMPEPSPAEISGKEQARVSGQPTAPPVETPVDTVDIEAADIEIPAVQAMQATPAPSVEEIIERESYRSKHKPLAPILETPDEQPEMPVEKETPEATATPVPETTKPVYEEEPAPEAPEPAVQEPGPEPSPAEIAEREELRAEISETPPPVHEDEITETAPAEPVEEDIHAIVEAPEIPPPPTEQPAPPVAEAVEQPPRTTKPMKPLAVPPPLDIETSESAGIQAMELIDPSEGTLATEAEEEQVAAAEPPAEDALPEEEASVSREPVEIEEPEVAPEVADVEPRHEEIVSIEPEIELPSPPPPVEETPAVEPVKEKKPAGITPETRKVEHRRTLSDELTADASAMRKVEEIKKRLRNSQRDPYDLTSNLNNYGVHLIEIGEYQQSIEWLDKAILQNPTVAAYYRNRSVAYFHLGNIQEAVNDATIAINLGDVASEKLLKTIRQLAPEGQIGQ